MPPAPSPARPDRFNELYGETSRLVSWIICRGCSDVEGIVNDTDRKTDVPKN